jgi:hypothetical protein
MLECDRSLASHRYNHTGNDAEDGDDSDSDGDEEGGDERSPMTLLISAPNGLDLSTCLHRALLIAGDELSSAHG